MHSFGKLLDTSPVVRMSSSPRQPGRACWFLEWSLSCQSSLIDHKIHKDVKLVLEYSKPFLNISFCIFGWQGKPVNEQLLGKMITHSHQLQHLRKFPRAFVLMCCKSKHVNISHFIILSKKLLSFMFLHLFIKDTQHLSIYIGVKFRAVYFENRFSSSNHITHAAD